MLDIAGGKPAAPFAISTAASASSASSEAMSGAVTPFAASDLQIGRVQTPNKYTSEGDPTPTFTSGKGTPLGWLESSSGSSDYLSLDVSFNTPDITTPQAYTTTFSATPAWSKGIATLEVG